jgi:hypothetical protein
MAHLLRLLGTALVGIVAYIVLFAFAIDRPLTIKEALVYVEHKRSILESIQGNQKLLIFAGSNGRFSHRCETMSVILNVPCANLSVAAGTDLSYLFDYYKPFIRAGDVLYLPIEYPYFTSSRKPQIGLEGPLATRHNHAALMQFKSREIFASLFYFDIRYLLSGIGEMTLQAVGKGRRTSIATLTPQGDERGHNSIKAEGYRSFVKNVSLVIDPGAVLEEENWSSVDQVISWSIQHDVVVVGGLPTTFQDVDIPSSVIDFYKTYFTSRGAVFVRLENNSQYPRDAFFDSSYHLREEMQIEHSRNVAPLLIKFFHK